MRLGDVLHLAHVDVVIRHRLEIHHPVADEVREAEDDVIWRLAGLEGDHRLGVEITRRCVDHIDFSTGQLGKLLGMERGRLTHHRHGMRVDGQLAAAVVLLRHGLVGALAGDVPGVLDMRELVAPLVGLRGGGNH